MTNILSHEAREAVDHSIDNWLYVFKESCLPALEKVNFFEELDEKTIGLFRQFLAHQPNWTEVEPSQIVNGQATLMTIIHALGLRGCKAEHWTVKELRNIFDQLAGQKPKETPTQLTEVSREKIEKNLSSGLRPEVEIYLKRILKGLSIAQQNVESLAPDLPADEWDAHAKAFVEQFSEMMVMLTNECLDFKRFTPEIVEHCKSLAEAIVTHPYYNKIRQTLWYEIYLAGRSEDKFIRFIKLVDKRHP